MRIYTKTGDDGTTAAIGGRLVKDHERIEAYGTIDEVNAFIGMTMTCLTQERDTDLLHDLEEIQQHLFDCCSDLAVMKPELREYRLTEAHITHLEHRIDHYNGQTQEIEYFIIPGGARCSAMLHICRTTTRRAERRVISLERNAEHINPNVKKYLNRLSDLFFVMARVGNVREGAADVQYTRSKKAFKKRAGKELAPD